MSLTSYRPITCPVCYKMIAINSILQHFCFEHPKVPKFILKYPTSLHTMINLTDLGMESSCKAVIIVEKGSRFPKLETVKKDRSEVLEDKEQQRSYARSPLLLMVAFLDSKNVNKAEENKKKNKDKESIEESTIVQNQLLTKETDVILWICKTIDDEIIYNLLVSKEDKKFSYSFTGEAIHFRESQSPQKVYNKAECVVIRGSAASKMVNIYGHAHVYLTVFM